MQACEASPSPQAPCIVRATVLLHVTYAPAGKLMFRDVAPPAPTRSIAEYHMPPGSRTLIAPALCCCCHAENNGPLCRPEDALWGSHHCAQPAEKQGAQVRSHLVFAGTATLWTYSSASTSPQQSHDIQDTPNSIGHCSLVSNKHINTNITKQMIVIWITTPYPRLQARQRVAALPADVFGAFEHATFAAAAAVGCVRCCCETSLQQRLRW